MVKLFPSAREDYVAFSTIPTRWFDNDVYGHMNNTVHYQLFDTAVNGYLIEKNVLDFRHGSNVFLVVETGCRYFSELAFPDIIHAGINVSKLGTSSVTYQIGLFKGDNLYAAAEGHFVHVNVNKKSRRPINIGADLRNCLTSLMTKKAESF